MGPRRPPGAGHPTRTRGGHRRGVGDPSYASPSLEPAGSTPLGHRGDTAHADSAASLGARPSERLGGWGVRVVMGMRRPLAGWGESWQPRLAALPTSALTRPPGLGDGLAPSSDLPPSAARAQLDPTRRLMSGWGRFCRRGSVGAEPRAGGFQPRGCVQAAVQPEEGRRRGWGSSWEGRAATVRQGERSSPFAHTPARPTPRRSAPAHQAAKGLALSPAPGWDTQPIQSGPEGRGHRFLGGKAQGHLGGALNETPGEATVLSRSLATDLEGRRAAGGAAAGRARRLQHLGELLPSPDLAAQLGAPRHQRSASREGFAPHARPRGLSHQTLRQTPD